MQTGERPLETLRAGPRKVLLPPAALALICAKISFGALTMPMWAKLVTRLARAAADLRRGADRTLPHQPERRKFGRRESQVEQLLRHVPRRIARAVLEPEPPRYEYQAQLMPKMDGAHVAHAERPLIYLPRFVWSVKLTYFVDVAFCDAASDGTSDRTTSHPVVCRNCRDAFRLGGHPLLPGAGAQ